MRNLYSGAISAFARGPFRDWGGDGYLPFPVAARITEHHLGEDFGCRWRTGIIPGITVFLPLCLEYLLVVHQAEKVTMPRWTIYSPEKMVVPSARPQAREMCSPP